jgi:hypothetical protein
MSDDFLNNLFAADSELYNYYFNIRSLELVPEVTAEVEKRNGDDQMFEELIHQRCREGFASLDVGDREKLKAEFEAQRNVRVEDSEQQLVGEEKLFDQFVWEKYDEVRDEILKTQPELKEKREQGVPDTETKLYELVVARLREILDVMSDEEKTALGNRSGQNVNNDKNSAKNTDKPQINDS